MKSTAQYCTVSMGVGVEVGVGVGVGSGSRSRSKSECNMGVPLFFFWSGAAFLPPPFGWSCSFPSPLLGGAAVSR